MRQPTRWTPGGEPQPMTSAQTRFLQEKMKNLKKTKNSLPFLAPVDPVALNIPTYTEIIKQPMDLGTMEQKLKSGQYDGLSSLRVPSTTSHNENSSISSNDAFLPPAPAAIQPPQALNEIVPNDQVLFRSDPSVDRQWQTQLTTAHTCLNLFTRDVLTKVTTALVL